jgi:hypothetical protein
VLPKQFGPDELMIEWGDVPAGAEAEVYLPDADADHILALAAQLYTTHRLTKADAHTIRCHTDGITYVPIPSGGDVSLPSLFTINLPAGVRKGDVHTVAVRQVTSAAAISREVEAAEVPARARRGRRAPAQATLAALDGTAAAQRLTRWRRVIGAFHVNIPVGTRHELLAGEERLLSVLRWIELSIPVEDRWYLVFRRYVEQIAHRVHDLGGDPTLVKPDPNGIWHVEHRPGEPGEEAGERLISFTGKVSALVYDRFGDFVGFRLDTEDGERNFHSREPEVEALSRRAWAERIRITVLAERHDQEHPMTLILRAR